MVVSNILAAILTVSSFTFTYTGCPQVYEETGFVAHTQGVKMLYTIEQENICDNPEENHTGVLLVPNVSAVDVFLDGSYVTSSNEIFYVYTPVVLGE